MRNDLIFKQYGINEDYNFKRLEIGDRFIDRWSSTKSATESKEYHEKNYTIFVKIDKSTAKVDSSPSGSRYPMDCTVDFRWNNVITKLDSIVYKDSVKTFLVYFENGELKTTIHYKNIPEGCLYSLVSGSSFTKKVIYDD